MKSDMHSKKTRELPRMAFSIAELAASTDISERKLYQELRDGRLGHIRIGRRVLVTREQAEDYFARCAIQVFDAGVVAASILD